MLIKRQPDLTYADVTPKGLYMGRRNFLLGLLATGAAVEAYKKLPGLVSASGIGSVPVKLNGVVKWPDSTMDTLTPIEKVTTYNNYYEFGVDKDDPAKNAKNFVTSPWTVSVEGEVAKPRKFTHGRNPEAGAARGAHLPPSLRRGVVDRGAVDRLFVQHHRKIGRADSESKVRGFRDVLRSASRCLWEAKRVSSCRTWRDCGSTRP